MLKNRRKKARLIASGFVVLLLGLLGSSFWSPSYTTCSDKYQAQASDSEKNKTKHTFGWIILRCQGEFVDENDKVITALFTLALVVSTTLLWLATGDIVTGAEEASAKELRAYPGIQGANIRIVGDEVRIRITVRNFSRTTAFGFRYAIGSQVRDVRAADRFGYPHRDRSKWDMVPQATTTMRWTHHLAPGEEASITAGTDRALFISGCAIYRDIWRARRWIRFRYQTTSFNPAPHRLDSGVIASVPACDEPDAVFFKSN
jgi:hypothetical protein